MRPPVVLLLLAFMALISAKTVTYHFTATYVQANPDGLFESRVIGINNVWPPPTIEVDKGDLLVVYFTNGLDDTNSSIHWHGLYQNDTTNMDGPAMVSQCPVGPGVSIVYNFTVNQNGTYWYHAHVPVQYADGFRAPLIVHNKKALFDDMYDEEIHDEMSVLTAEFMAPFRVIGTDPIPNSILLNDTLNSTIRIKPDKTYLIRIVNMGAFVSQYFWIEDHDFRIVEVDSIYTEPTTTDFIYIGVAQRYALFLTTKKSTKKNYAIGTLLDVTMGTRLPNATGINQTNWLAYNDDKSDYYNADPNLKNLTDEKLLPEPDYQIVLNTSEGPLLDNVNYHYFNNITYIEPKVPTLYTVLSAGKDADNALVYGKNTNPFILKHNDVIQLVVNNGNGTTHPFHLHGHDFQVINRSPSYGFAKSVPYDPNSPDNIPFPKIPMRRDTVIMNPGGHFVLRFRANNPGAWSFHCHLKWHFRQGLAVTLIEAPFELQKLKINPVNLAACAAVHVPTIGNAAGNGNNYLDLTGQNLQLPFAV